MLRSLDHYGLVRSRKNRRLQSRFRTERIRSSGSLSDFYQEKAILDSFPTLLALSATVEPFNHAQRNEASSSFSSDKEDELETEMDSRTSSEVSHYVESDTRSLRSTQKKQIYGILRRASFSSSLISGIRNVLSHRYSLSSFATSDRCSISTESVTGDEEPQFAFQHKPVYSRSPRGTLLFHRHTIERLNKDLIEFCCSNTPSCIHKRIIDTTIGLPDASGGLQDDENDEDMNHFNASTGHGNTALFFAARSGAPVNVLFTLIERTRDVNAVNDDGQTFLFFLDPQHASFSYCECSSQSGLPHKSGFECLIRRLESCSFNFDQIDHHGRQFLSYLFASPSFYPLWLFQIVETDFSWEERVRLLSRIRDSSGAYLRDFISLNHFYKKFPSEFALCTIGMEGITSNADLSDGEQAIVEAKTYDQSGRTYLMKFVNEACNSWTDEKLIVSMTRELVNYGANVNARAVDGSTVLHIAAGHGYYPELLECFLSAGAQVNHRNNAGFTALDYAGQHFLQSRSSKARVIDTVRSFKTAIRLLDFALLRLGKSRYAEREIPRRQGSD